VVADHAHREGAFLVIDALVKNMSGRLEPGQEGTVLVITPWHGGIERLRYMITWRQAGRQYQGAVEHGIVPG